jgi:hypothetical protein
MIDQTADFEAIGVSLAIRRHLTKVGCLNRDLASKLLIELRVGSHVRFLAQDQSAVSKAKVSQNIFERIPQMNLADGNVYVRGMLDLVLPQSFFNPHIFSLLQALILGTFFY